IDRQLDRLSVHLSINLLKIWLRVPKLVRIAEDDQHQPVPVRSDPDKMLATMHDELPDCRFARPSKRVSQNSIAFIDLIAVWQKVVRLLEITGIDLVEIDKPRHVDGVLSFQL